MAFVEYSLLEVLKSIDRTLKRIAQALEDRPEQLDISYMASGEKAGDTND